MKDRSPNMSDIHRASDQREVLPPCPRRLTPMVLKRVRAGRHHHYVGKFKCATCHRTVTQAIELTSSPPLAIAPVPSRADLMRRGRLGPLVIASARFVQRGYDSAHPGILLIDARRPADPCFNYRPQPAEARSITAGARFKSPTCRASGAAQVGDNAEPAYSRQRLDLGPTYGSGPLLKQ